MYDPVLLFADPLEQAPGQTHIHLVVRPPLCMGCIYRYQAHPKATPEHTVAPHPVLVPRVHVADDLHQVLRVNAADPLLGWAKR